MLTELNKIKVERITRYKTTFTATIRIKETWIEYLFKRKTRRLTRPEDSVRGNKFSSKGLYQKRISVVTYSHSPELAKVTALNELSREYEEDIRNNHHYVVVDINLEPINIMIKKPNSEYEPL